MSTPAVELVGLSKSFGSVIAVDDVDLRIEDGEFFSMLGPSGSGKTTVLRMVAGFEQPTAGRVELEGADVTRRPPFARDVNTVFQDYALFPHMDVLANVEYGLRVKRVPRAQRRERAMAALESVQLGAMAERRPTQLSGGQRQRVALARALVNRPKVLLLDEPLGALDLKLRRAMQLELKELQREVGITFVFVTHDQEEALTMSDRIAVFRDGRIEQVATPAELYETPATAFVAGFVGTSNLLTGDVAKAVLGREGTFSIRPEKIHLDPEVEAGSHVCARHARRGDLPRCGQPLPRRARRGPDPHRPAPEPPRGHRPRHGPARAARHHRLGGRARDRPLGSSQAALGPTQGEGDVMKRTSMRAAAAATAVLALVLTGCGTSSGDGEGSGTSGTEEQGAFTAPDVPMAEELGDTEGSLSVLAWPGYAEDGSTDASVDWVTPFEKETGCQVEVKYFGTSDEAVSLMKSGQYDVVSASGDASLRLVAGGDVAPVNTDLIDNYADVWSFLKDRRVELGRRPDVRRPARLRRQPADVQHRGGHPGADELERGVRRRLGPLREGDGVRLARSTSRTRRST